MALDELPPKLKTSFQRGALSPQNWLGLDQLAPQMGTTWPHLDPILEQLVALELGAEAGPKAAEMAQMGPKLN